MSKFRLIAVSKANKEMKLSVCKINGVVFLMKSPCLPEAHQPFFMIEILRRQIERDEVKIHLNGEQIVNNLYEWWIEQVPNPL